MASAMLISLTMPLPAISKAVPWFKGLGRDVALVMIQGQDAVVAAQGCLMENGVRADGAGHGIAFRLELFHGRCDLVDFLPAEEAVLAAVGVEAGNGHGPLCDAQAPESCKALLDTGLDVVFCDVIQHSPQGFVTCQEEDTKTVVWPMKGTSAACRASLLIGVVATASASPFMASSMLFLM